MDDTHTDEILDDLAELFLTGVSDAPRSGPSAPGRHPTRNDRRAADEDRPALRLRDDSADLDDPAEMLVAAHVADDQPVLRLQTDDDDATDPMQSDRPVDTAPTPRRSLQVEAVFLGNLPGFAGPWLTQYAQYVAQHEGPVLVIQHNERQAELELVHAHGASESPSDVLDELDGDDPTMVEVLEAVSRRMSVGRWLIRMSGVQNRRDLDEALDADQWTLLCGADDTAVVGSYRLLKQLVEAGRKADVARPAQLMVMGADEQASRLVAENINVTASSFLQTPVELVGFQQRMEPVSAEFLGSYEMPDQPWSALKAKLVGTASASPIAEPVAVPPHDEPMTIIDWDETPQPIAPVQPQAVAVDEDDVRTAVDLAAHMPGSVKLEAGCPTHPDTMLLLDADGRVNVAMCHQLSKGGDIRSVIADLLDAWRWAGRHIKALSQTLRQCRFDISAEPIMHLFTDQAGPARQLSSALGGSLKVHLLQQVRVGGATKWTCCDLN